MFTWLSSHVCVSAVLTFSAGLHPWRRVDGVTEQTVTRHLQTHNSCTHRTCSTQSGRLTHLSWGKWGAPVPYTYFLLIRDFTYFIITFTVSLILVLFSQKQPAEKTIANIKLEITGRSWRLRPNFVTDDRFNFIRSDIFYFFRRARFEKKKRRGVRLLHSRRLNCKDLTSNNADFMFSPLWVFTTEK